MKKIRIGTNFTVFALFFGIAAIDAFTSRNYIWMAFWMVMGIFFLIADNLQDRSKG
jgi:hypothetical protein